MGQGLGSGSWTGLQGRSRQPLGRWWRKSYRPGRQGLHSLFLRKGLKVLIMAQSHLTPDLSFCLSSVTPSPPCSLCLGHTGLLTTLQNAKHVLFSGLLHELFPLSGLPLFQLLLCLLGHFAEISASMSHPQGDLHGPTHVKLHPAHPALSIPSFCSIFFYSTSYILT